MERDRLGLREEVERGGGDLLGRCSAAHVRGAGARDGAAVASMAAISRPPRLGGVEVVEHQRDRPEHADGVGETLARDVGGRAVHRLEHARGARGSGSRLADGAMPMLPVTAAARSLRMSPNRLLATITSKRLRAQHQLRRQGVDVLLDQLTSGWRAARSRTTSSQNGMLCTSPLDFVADVRRRRVRGDGQRVVGDRLMPWRVKTDSWIAVSPGPRDRTGRRPRCTRPRCSPGR